MCPQVSQMCTQLGCDYAIKAGHQSPAPPSRDVTRVELRVQGPSTYVTCEQKGSGGCHSSPSIGLGYQMTCNGCNLLALGLSVYETIGIEAYKSVLAWTLGLLLHRKT